MPFLSDEEFEKRYGVGGGQPQVLSDEEFTARYGVADAAPAEEPSAWQNTVSGIKRDLGVPIGMLKGAASTVFSLGDLASKIPGVSKVSEALGASPEYAEFAEDKPAALSPAGAGQSVGFGAERLAEFILPASKVAQVGKTAQGANLLTRAAGTAKNVAANTATDMGVSLAQGDDPLTAGAFSAGAQTGMIGLGAVGRLALGKAGRLLAGPMDGLAQIAQRYSVPLTKGQAYAGTVVKRTEAVLRRWGISADVFHKTDKAANEALQKAGEQIGRMIGGRRMEGIEFGEFVKEASERAMREAGESYGRTVDEIIKDSGNPQLNVTGNLQSEAARLREEWAGALELIPELRSVEGVGPAMAILERFANPVKAAAVDPLAQHVAAGMNPNAVAQIRSQIPEMADELISLDFATAKRLRTLLFKLSHSGNMTLGKADLSQLNKALHGAMKEALESSQAGAGAVKRFENASEAFRNAADDFKQGVVQGLMKVKASENVAHLILNNPESAGTYLRKVVSPSDMQNVERAAWEEILTSSTEDGILVGQKLKRFIDGLRPKGQAALFRNPAHLKEIQDFAEMADRLRHTKALAGEPSALGGYLGPGVGTAVVGVTSAVWQFSPTGALLAGGGLLTVTMGPRQIAKVLAQPGGPRLAQEALISPANSPRGRQIAALLFRIAGVKATGASAQGAGASAE